MNRDVHMARWLMLPKRHSVGTYRTLDPEKDFKEEIVNTLDLLQGWADDVLIDTLEHFDEYEIENEAIIYREPLRDGSEVRVSDWVCYDVTRHILGIKVDLIKKHPYGMHNTEEYIHPSEYGTGGKNLILIPWKKRDDIFEFIKLEGGVDGMDRC